MGSRAFYCKGFAVILSLFGAATARTAPPGPHDAADGSARPTSDEDSIAGLGCSSIGEYVAANQGRLPESISGWQKLIEANGGARRAIFPLSRAPAAVDFDFPRFLVGSRTAPSASTWTSRERTGDIFIGMVPDENDRGRHHLEFISWNPQRAAFDFGIIKDFNNPSRRKIVTSGPEIAACFSCHKNQGPIYGQGDSWVGSIGSNGNVGRHFTNLFFERAIHRSPEYYRKEIELGKSGASFSKVIAGSTIRLPGGEDTGFRFNDSPAGIDAPIRAANARRRFYELLKKQNPEAREDFFRSVLEAAVFGSTDGSGDRPKVMYDMDTEVDASMKKRGHPSFIGDALGGFSPPPLFNDDPVEYVKRRREGTLRVPVDFSVAAADGIFHSSRASGRLSPTDMLKLAPTDRLIFDALNSDVPRALVDKVMRAALRSKELSRVLREGIPQRERMLATLVSALRAEAAARGIAATPALDKINYVPHACEHRWGQEDKRQIDAPVTTTGACLRCHRSPERPRLDFGFDPGDAEAWRAKFAGADAIARARLKDKLQSAIEYLEDGSMPPKTATESKAFSETERKKLLARLRGVKVAP